jgi:hypothetical protein
MSCRPVFSNCGFWPGNDAVPFPAFYAYVYPEPKGFPDARARPETAFYSPELKEFILPYAEVRQADSPDSLLLEFLQSLYEVAADLGHWDRPSLERTRPANIPPFSRPKSCPSETAA